MNGPKPKPIHERRARYRDIKDRHLAAVNEYFKNGFDAKAAAASVGIKTHQAVFDRADVRDEIAKRMKEGAVDGGVTIEWVIERLKRVAQAPEVLAKFIQVQKDGSLAYDFRGATKEELSYINSFQSDTFLDGDARIVKKFKVELTDPKAALDSLARYLGMFKDKVEIETGSNLAELLQRGRERARIEGGELKAIEYDEE